MDAEVNMKWTKHTLHNGLGDAPTEKLLLADSVSFQLAQGFHEACIEMSSTVYFLPNNQIRCNH